MAKPTKQVQRIMDMESLLDDVLPKVKAFEEALETFAGAREDIATLAGYYESPTWMNDYEADEAGQLPADLKRGVLSEDALYDLLTDYRRLHEEMLDVVEAYLGPDGE